MGHGNSNKLYITHAEHSGLHGAHSSSIGHKQKAEAHPAQITPFDCCAISFQEFKNPVCAANADGTGTVFDLVNIIPWLKQHNNEHPITKAPLTPADLITLHYSRKEASGELHDPISFKPFSQHSHIVAIKTTGNVFLAESIKGGRDLVADVPFKKEDVVTLQNPHGLPSASLPSVAPIATSSKPTPKPQTVASAVPVKAKIEDPWNVSPYSNGLPGASLTSTSVDPQAAASSKLVWDEEELMFEDISNPPKGKAKEKDVGKRRAYVRVVTTLGGSSLNLELYCEKAPKTCYNFLMLARSHKFDNCLFHRLVPDFMIQTGDPTGTGAGGTSYWETPFRDEHDLKGAAKHDSRGTLAMANKGAGTNGSQWYLTFRATPHLDKKHTVFGKLVGGEDVLDALEKLPLKPGTERPAQPVRIKEVIIYQDPFQEYKDRLAKKLARKKEAEQGTGTDGVMQKKEGDDMNAFGVKLGSGNSVFGAAREGGVGKYLNLKRPTPATDGGSEKKKQRTTGFGSFDNW
ncbi:Cyclophilin-type peptidyl-prolyl cis-trans isomerase [Mycena indigotica]|uniref:Cyclophilin-type peptidyl-prolyl cis-trans isomerase n=1 Tax=Mycena indigotica TaxID=2126181 RepID=A0A8H6SWZ5_9AGAR|nr:Cyclophilin-type peptidyl-prolyl cis-trans isomerase [Mycena indigotica]KAF7306818.1 Cyclophilin-type peptidyl-prolyl cis-trans isomerase [Mycena indigotica]